MFSHRVWSTTSLLLCVLGTSTVFLAPAISSGTFGDPTFRGKSKQTKSSLVPHRQLQFVHIPKTAGAFLEELAAKHKVTWSRCHFEKDASVKVPCPSNWKTPDANLNFGQYRKAKFIEDGPPFGISHLDTFARTGQYLSKDCEISIEKQTSFASSGILTIDSSVNGITGLPFLIHSSLEVVTLQTM